MHSDGEKAVRTLLFELEWYGYLKKHQIRNRKGVILDYNYEFFNISQKPDFNKPVPKWEDRKKYNQVLKIVIIDDKNYEVKKPETTANTESYPHCQNAVAVKTDVVNEVQLSTNTLNTNNINHIKSYQIKAYYKY